MKKMAVAAQAGFFAALSDPVRLAIVETLLAQDQCLCVCDLVPLVGRDQSVVYRHLTILEEVGIVSLKKQGKFLHCCIKDKQRVGVLLLLQGDIMEKKQVKKGMFAKLLDSMDEKAEERSKKQCCGKGGCCK